MRTFATVIAQRVYSNKTRIKTYSAGFHQPCLATLKEYIPIKQGLRHFHLVFQRLQLLLKEYIPIKQGLRLYDTENFLHTLIFTQRVYSNKTRIKTRLIRRRRRRPCNLKEYIPIKQGLRLPALLLER